MAAKRSPILGYNHNVRYRGLVFHVQTEDSGVLSPHLFTHMFHGGVIVSTRKLVYDAGSAEDSIKSLMQAQHKAVLKDLKRGQFDDKIDEYLGDAPGLLPRGALDVDRPSMPEIEVIPGVELEPATTPLSAVGVPTVTDRSPSLSGAVTIVNVRVQTDADEPALEPPPPMEDPPTLVNMARRVGAAGALPGPASDPEPDDELELVIDDELDGEPAPRTSSQTSPPSVSGRASRDTEVQPFADAASDGIPREHGQRPSGRATMPGVAMPDSEPRARMPDATPPVPPPASDKRIGASSLPPMRQTPRPPPRPAIVAPTVVARPATRDGSRSDPRARDESDAVEIYAPLPASGPDPSGVHSDRAGQYSLRRGSQKYEVPPTVESPQAEPSKPRDRSGSAAIPAGLARPGRSGAVRAGTMPPSEVLSPPPPRPGRARNDSASGAQPVVGAPVAAAPTLPVTPKPRMPAPPVEPTPVAARSGTPRVAPPATLPVAAPAGPPGATAQERPRSISSTGQERSRTGSPAQYMGRTTTPARVVSPSSRSNSPSNSGVVMTRPAVIVGAPAKPPQPRVRTAREEGRGFGQGLISEKSLDEVILAYLSEDAEGK